MLFLEDIHNEFELIMKDGSERTKEQVIEFFQGQIITLLQKAVLSGEYYDEQATTFTKKIETLIFRSNLVGSRDKRSWDDINQERFFKYLSIFQTRYFRPFVTLIGNVEKSLDSFLKGGDGKIIDIQTFQIYATIKELTELLDLDSDKTEEINDYCLFRTNLLLAYLDEYLECNSEFISILKSIRSFLHEPNTNKFNKEILSILIDKTEFLEYKIDLRNSRPSRDGENIQLSVPSLATTNVYNAFIEKIETHYIELEHSDFSLITQEIADLKTIELSKIKLEPLHHINRIYHKIDKGNLIYRKQAIDNLVNIINKRRKELTNSATETKYNKIAFTSIYKLLSNTSLSLHFEIQCANEFPDILPHFKKYISGQTLVIEPDFLVKYKSKIRELSEESQFPDYYCYILFIKFINRLIKYIINNPTSILNKEKNLSVKDIKNPIDNISKYLENTYKENINTLKHRLSKMMTYQVKPAYLTYEECKIPYNWQGTVGGVLFIDSSYILPNNFERIKAKISSWESYLGTSLNHLHDAVEIATGQLEITDNILSFEKRVKENEFKVVQIVAMFVSIATFVLINVKIFDQKTGIESFGIILGLAACFFLFNIFFHIIIAAQFEKGKVVWSYSKKVSWSLIIPLIFGAASYIILIKNDQNTTIVIQLLQKQVDSLKNNVNNIQTVAPIKAGPDSIETTKTKIKSDKPDH